MQVKRYEARDMQQAMDDIVKELGSEAVILNSRKIRKKGLVSLFSKPLVEVMVAYEPKKPRDNGRGKPPAALAVAAREAYSPYIGDVYAEPEYAPPPAPHLASASAQPVKIAVPGNGAAALELAAPLKSSLAPTQSSATANKISDIDSRIDSLDHVLNDFMHKFAHIKRDVTYDFSPAVEQLVLAMCENQVREEVALSLAKQAEEILNSRKDANAYEVMHHLVTENLGEPAPITLKKYKQKVILFLGPTGVGKTTSLVKLASAFAINHRKRVGIINTDTYRIAAHEQLRTYADILDIPLSIAYRMEEVEAALTDMSERDLIFIDTAGKRPGDPQHQQDISQIIAYAKPEEIFLCVAAPTCFSAIREVVDTYAFTGDFKLLITKLDETRYHGMVLNTVDYAKKPLAYVTTGQNVPDDLETADCQALAQQILER